jgi:large-conductance mechanosensitive channel
MNYLAQTNTTAWNIGSTIFSLIGLAIIVFIVVLAVRLIKKAAKKTKK